MHSQIRLERWEKIQPSRDLKLYNISELVEVQICLYKENELTQNI